MLYGFKYLLKCIRLVIYKWGFIKENKFIVIPYIANDVFTDILTFEVAAIVSFKARKFLRTKNL